MTIRLLEVKDREGIEQVAALAEHIWREHYPPMIGQAQVNYMLQKFQSPEAIQNQIAFEGYRFFLIQGPGQKKIGYAAVVPQKCSLFLSKFYLVREARGLGYARQSMGFIECLARESGCSKIFLTVNKKNPSVAAYEKMGFKKAGSLLQDIGNGFFMDDFKMEKRFAGRKKA